MQSEWWRTDLFSLGTVIVDNLSSHKVAGVQQAIAAAGATLLYLPPYSPDLNPIEKLFAKLKALLRKAATRTTDALWEEFGQLLASFSPRSAPTTSPLPVMYILKLKTL